MTKGGVQPKPKPKPKLKLKLGLKLGRGRRTRTTWGGESETRNDNRMESQGLYQCFGERANQGFSVWFVGRGKAQRGRETTRWPGQLIGRGPGSGRVERRALRPCGNGSDVVRGTASAQLRCAWAGWRKGRESKSVCVRVCGVR